MNIWYDSVYNIKDSKVTTKILLKLKNTFIEVAQYKIYAQPSIALRGTNKMNMTKK